MQRTVETSSPDETFRLGAALGRALGGGEVIGLAGDLGAGKTQLVRAVAEGLGVPDSRIVSSPTFVLLQEYHGRLPIYHFDAYRLASEAEFLDLGGHEFLAADGVCLIEWADRVEGCLPRERLTVHLEVTGEHSRRAALEGSGSHYEEVIAALMAG